MANSSRAPPTVDVALRKESVDRNCLGAKADSPTKVALRKESVDRNGVGSWPRVMNLSSLSARRAWIEIRARIQYCT